MALTPFEYRLGLDQGRVEPETRAASPEDNPQPAELVALASQPYPLQDLDNLLISINGGTTQQVVFATGDFANIAQATAAEVAAVISTQLAGVAGDVAGLQTRLRTVATGLSASFKIVGGSAQNVIQFPSGLVQGTQGRWSFVLGHEQPGQVFRFTTGNGVTVSQSADVGDALVWRIRGAARWRPGGNEGTSGWKLDFQVGTTTHVSLVDTQTIDPDLPPLVSLDDVAVNLSGLAGSQEIAVVLETTNSISGDFYQELPAAFIDFVELDENADPLEVANRYPTPGMVEVTPTLAETVTFDVLNMTANPLILASTQILVNNAVAYAVGSFTGGFSGTVTSGLGPSARDTRFEIDLSSLAPFDSEKVITIEIDTETSGDTLNDAWSFTMEDTIGPVVVRAQARSKNVVRVTFSEPVLMDDSDAGALKAGNYDLNPLSTPAVTVLPVSVAMVDAFSVDVTVDLDLSMNADYEILVFNVEDIVENPINTSVNRAEFAAFLPPIPAGRSFQLWDRIPPHDQRQDEENPNRPLRKFILVLQDVVDLLLCEIDRWTRIIDIDLAPESFLNAILRDLGNPFDFVSLGLNKKRRLARILIDIYKQKGTEVGVINAIRFFLGIEVELDIINFRDYWRIGANYLNIDTVIGPAEGSPLWYSFHIVSPVILTEEQRTQMLKIADYMKVAHEHILSIHEPGGIVTPTKFWRMGIDTLGTTTVLGA